MSTELHELFAKYDKMAGTGYDIDPVYVEFIERKITKPLQAEIAQLRSKIAAADLLRGCVSIGVFEGEVCTGLNPHSDVDLEQAIREYDAAPVGASEPSPLPTLHDDPQATRESATFFRGRDTIGQGDYPPYDDVPPDDDDDDTQDPRKQARPHRERINDLVTRADALSGRFDIHMRQIAGLDKRLTQVTNSFTGHREWVKTAIDDLDNRVGNVSNVHNSLAEMVHAMDDRVEAYGTGQQKTADYVESMIADLQDRVIAMETDDPEDDDNDTPAVSLGMIVAAHQAYKKYEEVKPSGMRWKLAIQAALVAQGRREA